MKNPIYPCLWFDGKAKEAAEFYCSIFDHSVITTETPLVVIIESAGQKFMFLNGGPQFTINPSVSFYVLYEKEKEIGQVWNKLLEAGSVLMPLDKYDWSAKYGWIQDRYGISWQLSLGKMAEVGQKFTPFLMFTGGQNGKANQAIRFYTSVFEDSSVTGILRYSKDENEVEGSVKHAQFSLGKHVFMVMDSSLPHQFSFNEAISFVVDCETQEEIDYYWSTLSEGGREDQCGWLKDKFGVSWQIVPTILSTLMTDTSRSERVLNAFLKMKKFDIEKLVNA
ncbi:MAG: VOC family protein [Bacteroidales bacterium]|jgi:predicted 3-demethylubiquinone-9 3-methyltransferase (glyoxalase superfamily)|nr:VOC family protein [Bacteroidales bacterium]